MIVKEGIIMKRLRVPRSEVMIFRMLNGKWMRDRRVARLLHCEPNDAYGKVKEIARKHNLYSMRIEESENGGWITVIKPRAKATVKKFVSILPQ